LLPRTTTAPPRTVSMGSPSGTGRSAPQAVTGGEGLELVYSATLHQRATPAPLLIFPQPSPAHPLERRIDGTLLAWQTGRGTGSPSRQVNTRWAATRSLPPRFSSVKAELPENAQTVPSIEPKAASHPSGLASYLTDDGFLLGVRRAGVREATGRRARANRASMMAADANPRGSTAPEASLTGLGHEAGQRRFWAFISTRGLERLERLRRCGRESCPVRRAGVSRCASASSRDGRRFRIESGRGQERGR
jgi:hypothetical protein